MSLRLKLIISSIILVILSCILGGFILYAENLVSNEANIPNGVNKVISGFLNLDVANDILTSNYNLAAVTQWQKTFQQTSDDLSSIKLTTREEKATVANIQQDLANLQDSLTQLNNGESLAGTQSGNLLETYSEKLRVQIQTGIEDSFKLQDIASQNLIDQQATTKTVVMILTIFLTIIILINSIYILLSVTVPIRSLTRVIEDISRGKLDASIDNTVLKKTDEIGMLARAFDRTIVSLKLAMRDKSTTNSDAAEKKEA